VHVCMSISMRVFGVCCTVHVHEYVCAYMCMCTSIGVCCMVHVYEYVSACMCIYTSVLCYFGACTRVYCMCAIMSILPIFYGACIHVYMCMSEHIYASICCMLYGALYEYICTYI